MTSPTASYQQRFAARVSMFGIALDRVNMEGAVRVLTQQLANAERESHMVVTPNTDHVVMLQSRPAFMEAYRSAFLVVADGKPVVWASKLLGKSLPGTVPGSDLVPALFDALPQGSHMTRVFLFGAGPGVAVRASQAIAARWGRAIEVVGAVSPDFGFEHDAIASTAFAKTIAESQADILLVGVGAPKQELWSQKYRAQLNVKVIMCVGATIDFLAGEKQRCPRWMQRIGFEWFYRMCQEPKRLVKRYATDAVVFPVLFLKEFVRHSR
jgi:N-acetylglucosaminyldiphosphoundecaprenol N-acetyl-beta-D-mannosaminyltransferase